MFKLGGQQSYASEGFQPLITEEPDEGNLHVRICEGPGWVTTGSTRNQTSPQFNKIVWGTGR